MLTLFKINLNIICTINLKSPMYRTGIEHRFSAWKWWGKCLSTIILLLHELKKKFYTKVGKESSIGTN